MELFIQGLFLIFVFTVSAASCAFGASLIWEIWEIRKVRLDISIDDVCYSLFGIAFIVLGILIFLAASSCVIN